MLGIEFNVSLARGLKENLPTEGDRGEAFVTTDTRELFIGRGPGMPLAKISDVVFVTNKADLPLLGITEKLYCVLADESQKSKFSMYYWVNETIKYKLLITANVTPEEIGASAVGHGHTWTEISGKPLVYPPAQHQHTAEEIGAATMADVQQAISDLTLDGGVHE